MTRSNYEERQVARKERLLERADKADRRADDAERAVDEIAGAIPMGQPILVGHHSERRHRRDLERIDRGMRKTIEERKYADDLRRRAESVGTAGVSSDDPDAVTKLQAKHDELERKQEQMRDLNAAWRKAGKPDPTDAERWKAIADTVGLTSDELDELRIKLAKRPPWEDFRPALSWELQNNGAEIRRLKRRLAELAAAEGAEHLEVDHGVCQLVEDPDDNRVRLVFDAKPPDHVRALLKRFGFRWSRQSQAWQRHLNNAGRYAAKSVIEELKREAN